MQVLERIKRAFGGASKEVDPKRELKAKLDAFQKDLEFFRDICTTFLDRNRKKLDCTQIVKSAKHARDELSKQAFEVFGTVPSSYSGFNAKNSPELLSDRFADIFNLWSLVRKQMEEGKMEAAHKNLSKMVAGLNGIWF